MTAQLMPMTTLEAPAAPRKRPGKGRSAPKAIERPAPVRRAAEEAWAHGYVWGAAAVSCGLNGLAFSSHAAPGLAWAAWGLGIVVPAGVLALGRWAATLFRRGRKTLSAAVGAIAGALLLLSVWHCTESIAALTGSPLVLAGLMAIAVDAGMAACEVSVTVAGRR